MVPQTREDMHISWGDAVSRARWAYEHGDEYAMWRWLVRGASGMYFLAPELEQ